MPKGARMYLDIEGTRFADVVSNGDGTGFVTPHAVEVDGTVFQVTSADIGTPVISAAESKRIAERQTAALLQKIRRRSARAARKARRKNR
jgi:hypothetical protein